MTPLEDIGAVLDAPARESTPVQCAQEYLAIGEAILGHWIAAHDQEPTGARSEGFRLLALHRQAAKGDPSFNACRETCRELVFHFNLIAAEPESEAAVGHAKMMRFVLRHLYLFVCGKMQVAGLGEFCCSSRPLRTQSSPSEGNDEHADGARM